MHIGWPQGIWLVLVVLSIGKAIARFGETKKPDKYDEVDVFVGPAVAAGLMYWGGFFGG